MKPIVLLVACGILFEIFSTTLLSADQLEMQNGDRYVGKILSVTDENVLLQSDVLGKIKLPRNKVANLAFGTNAAAPKAVARNEATASVPTNLPDVSSLNALTKANPDLAATAENLAANFELVRQVREQMLAGSPEAGGKYDELVSGFASGRLYISDIHREAKSSADQLRKLKGELGPEASDSLDAYLQVLESFIKESANTPVAPASPPKNPVR